jgi:predicted metalloendopeptidase
MAAVHFLLTFLHVFCQIAQMWRRKEKMDQQQSNPDPTSSSHLANCCSYLNFPEGFNNTVFFCGGGEGAGRHLHLGELSQ